MLQVEEICDSGTSRIRILADATISGRSQPVGIAYDWVSDRLYWTDETYGRIISARNNGSEKLIIAASSRPRAIAVHPCKGFAIVTEIKGEEKSSSL